MELIELNCWWLGRSRAERLYLTWYGLSLTRQLKGHMTVHTMALAATLGLLFSFLPSLGKEASLNYLLESNNSINSSICS